MATHSSILAWRIPWTGELWWAAVYGVAQNWTRLKQLSISSSKLEKKKKLFTGNQILYTGNPRDPKKN